MLGIVLEQGVAPCRTALCDTVDGIRSSGSRAAPDGRASGSVRDIHSLAEELSDETCVRGLGTACAGAGEFKQRLFELAVLEEREGGGLLRNVFNAVIEYSLLCRLGLLGLHYESSLFGSAGSLCLCGDGADVHAESAAHTVKRADSHCELKPCNVLAEGLCGVSDVPGSRLCLFLVQEVGTDGGMRTYKCALVALDAVFGDPFRNVNRDSALLVCGCALRIGTVCAVPECRNREGIAEHF